MHTRVSDCQCYRHWKQSRPQGLLHTAHDEEVRICSYTQCCGEDRLLHHHSNGRNCSTDSAQIAVDWSQLIWKVKTTLLNSKCLNWVMRDERLLRWRIRGRLEWESSSSRCPERNLCQTEMPFRQLHIWISVLKVPRCSSKWQSPSYNYSIQKFQPYDKKWILIQQKEAIF